MGVANLPVDPGLGAERARVVWLPHLNAATVVVGPAPDGFIEARTIGDVTLALSRLTQSGVLGPFGPRGDGLPTVLIGGADGDRPAAVVIPLDDNFAMRLTAAGRLFAAIAGRAPARPPNALSIHQRRRLTLMLRGLDGRLAGYSYREIAIRLFAPRFIPAGREWKTSALRARTIRLCSRGHNLMEGGYLDLLRHPRDFRG